MTIHDEEDFLVEEIDRLINECRHNEIAGRDGSKTLDELETMLKKLVNLRKRLRVN